MARVTTKYQITIPPEVRSSLSIHPGMDVGIVRKGNEFVLVINPIEALKKAWRGRFKGSQTTDGYINQIRGNAG